LPHIIGEDDLMQCVPELFAASETLHAKMGTMEGDALNKASAFEKHLQAWTTETLKAVERMTKEAEDLIG
jgi:hypothetical protein